MKGHLSLILAIGLVNICCDSRQDNYVYPSDKDISDVNGKPTDSTINFFPTKLWYQDSSIVVDQGFWYTQNLHIAKESILYNYYLGHDIYRFNWFRSFDAPVFIGLHKKGNKYWLTLRKLNKPYVKYSDHIKFIPPKGVSDEEAEAVYNHNKQMMESLNVLPTIQVEKEVEISKKNWDEFEDLLKECNYWHLHPSDERSTGLDGSRWIIEAHLKSKYWLVNRWSPRGCFRTCGEYLLRLSGIDERIY